MSVKWGNDREECKLRQEKQVTKSYFRNDTNVVSKSGCKMSLKIRSRRFKAAIGLILFKEWECTRPLHSVDPTVYSGISTTS